jgi:hypothetical protein
VSDIKVSGEGRAERGAGEAAPRMPRRGAPSRHGAISRELTKYASYKSWAEKVRSAFADGDEASGADGVNGGTNGHGAPRR